ncbi:hypothetical protein [Streptomyces sp. NPDC059761]|uniref:hypothetical protein n=1 Tax=Streptomyces sp. NPDC059761 TaxID=3346937 RepID=UPI00365AD627
MRATAKLVNDVIALAKTASNGRIDTTHGAGLNGTGSRWQANKANHVWLSAKGEGRAAIAYHLGVVMAYSNELPREYMDLHSLTNDEKLQEWYDKGIADGRHWKGIDAETTPEIYPKDIEDICVYLDKLTGRAFTPAPERMEDTPQNVASYLLGAAEEYHRHADMSGYGPTQFGHMVAGARKCLRNTPGFRLQAIHGASDAKPTLRKVDPAKLRAHIAELDFEQYPNETSEGAHLNGVQVGRIYTDRKKRVQVIDLHRNTDGKLNGIARVEIIDGSASHGHEIIDIGTAQLIRIRRRITTEHIQELASAYGENVLVPMPADYPAGDEPLWVIGTENKHYDGAQTVHATSEQVLDLVQGDDDYDEDENLTVAAAERIRQQIIDGDAYAAVDSAKGLKRPKGYTAHVMDEMNNG